MGMMSELLAVYTRRPIRVLRPKLELANLARSSLSGVAGLLLWKKYKLAKNGVDQFMSSLSDDGRQLFGWWLDNVATLSLTETMFGFLGMQKIWGYGTDNLRFYAKRFPEFRRPPAGDDHAAGNWNLSFEECWNPPPGWVAREEGLTFSLKDREAIVAGRYDRSDRSVDDWLADQGIEPDMRQQIVALAFWEYEEPTFFYVGFGYSMPDQSTLEILVKGYSRWRNPKPLPDEGEDYWELDEYHKRRKQKRRRVRRAVLARKYELSEHMWYKPRW